MKWTYDLTGAEPIIKDEQVYDAALIDDGELLMIGASAFSAGADAGIAFISAVGSTVASAQGVNAIGISLEKKDTSSSPSVAAAQNLTTGAVCYAKVIINPYAIYRAEVDEAAQLSVASGTTAEFAVTGIGAHSANGLWAYFTAGPNDGALRKVITSATAGTAVVDAALLATPTTADRVILFREKHGLPVRMNAAATMVGQSSAEMAGCTSFRVVENYIDRGAGIEILKQSSHGAGKVQSTTAKFYQDLTMKNHLYGAG